MGIAAQYRLEAAASTKAAPLASRCFICGDLRNEEVIAADAEIFLGIGHCRCNQLVDWHGSTLVDKAQHFKRFIGIFSTYQVNY